MRRRHDLELKPIGVIRSPYKNKGRAPYQGCKTEDISQIEVFEELEEGLQDIERFSHIIVIYWFHKSQGYRLLVRTPWDDVPHDVFATRSPHRPCPPGLIVVGPVARDRNIVTVKELDAIDGTPVLDVKPYIHEVDQRSIVKPGWPEGKLGKGKG